MLVRGQNQTFIMHTYNLTSRNVGGSTPGFPAPQVEACLGKTPNPTLSTDASIGV